MRTNTLGADMVSEQIMRVGAAGTAIQDRLDAQMGDEGPSKWDIIDPAMIEAMDEDVLVVGYLPADERTAERLMTLSSMLTGLTSDVIGFDAGTLAVSTNTVHDEDWAETWKSYYKPFRVGERLVVKPVWEDFDAKQDDIILEIDPGAAFGNGTHETTAMCLALLETELHAGDSVLDIGTGSGILALAAARLGASHVLAVDLDPVAARVAGENVERNGLSGVIDVQVGDLLAGIDIRADVVIANIIADVIILLSGAAAQHMKPGGTFLCSGIIRDREADVLSALSGAGFAVRHIERKGEWVAIVAGN